MFDQGQTKTEQPTQRRIERSREKGQVAYSVDLASGLTLLTLSFVGWMAGPWLAESLLRQLTRTMAILRWIADHEGSTAEFVSVSLNDLTWLVLPIAGAAFVLSLALGGLFTGFRMSAEPLTIDTDKLDPSKGLQRIFSSRSLVRGIMAVTKATILTGVAYLVLRQHADRIATTGGGTLAGSLAYAWTIIIQLMLAVSAAMVMIGLVDFLFQKWKHLQDLRMSRQELVDERKEEEGDPQIRARMRKLQRELNQRKMLGDVAKADVVVTNPTHFAVALKYDQRKMKNPKVVAKGANLLAKIIVATAKRNNVAVVEKKALARYLYAKVAIGQDIPVEAFQAVAEVLVYIYNLKEKRA